jgi:hypothetical protein
VLIPNFIGVIFGLIQIAAIAYLSIPKNYLTKEPLV